MFIAITVAILVQIMHIVKIIFAAKAQAICINVKETVAKMKLNALMGDLCAYGTVAQQNQPHISHQNV